LKNCEVLEHNIKPAWIDFDDLFISEISLKKCCFSGTFAQDEDIMLSDCHLTDEEHSGYNG